jgi:hypothetical protein
VIDITDVTVLDGSLGADTPVIVIDAMTASRALDLGNAHDLLQQGLNALGLSGKRVVFLKEDAA